MIQYRHKYDNLHTYMTHRHIVCRKPTNDESCGFGFQSLLTDSAVEYKRTLVTFDYNICNPMRLYSS